MTGDGDSGEPVGVPAIYCGRCGAAAVELVGGCSVGCAERLVLEPPRYCRICRRRMKVQVDPFGWSAECSRHGNVAS